MLLVQAVRGRAVRAAAGLSVGVHRAEECGALRHQRHRGDMVDLRYLVLINLPHLIVQNLLEFEFLAVSMAGHEIAPLPPMSSLKA